MRRLDRLEAILAGIQVQLTLMHLPDKEAFTPAEFGELTGLSTFTVQDHCRRGRIRATRALSGRGSGRGWRISLDELKRYQREGLLPDLRSPRRRSLPSPASVEVPDE